MIKWEALGMLVDRGACTHSSERYTQRKDLLRRHQNALLLADGSSFVPAQALLLRGMLAPQLHQGGDGALHLLLTQLPLAPGPALGVSQ